jgi:intracellular septation protein
MKALLDFVPLVLFFYFAKANGIFVATQALLISSLVVYGIFFVLQKGRLEKSQWITFLLTVAFGSMTLLLHDDTWLRWKSPVINWIFGTAMILSNVLRFGGEPAKPIPQRMLHQVFELSTRGWQRLSLAWAVYFYVLGGVHLLFAFVWPALWIDFKVFGSMGITLAFLVVNMLALKQYMRPQDSLKP